MANGSRQAAWEFFGAELKRRREDAGFTQVELGSRVFVSGGYIGQFEQAIRKPQLDVAQRIDEILQTDGFFERTWRKLIDDKRYADYFAEVVELERAATKICQFAPSVIPGLLQTAAYARAVTIAANPFVTDEYVEEKVSARLERARILKDATRPEYWAILHENVLRVPVGGPAAMVMQLEHIAALADGRRVLVTVVPREEGACASMAAMMQLMEFDDAPPTLYTETSFSGELLDDPAVVKRAQRAYDLLRGAALSPKTSLALIESAAEDYRRCASTT
ncbi:XRE family transcriptional regulator [Streptomyces avermitilis]|uniref:DNA-binding protein n=3 Tax=Streptomyces avermitilis TaxID=33903 RepID=Q82BS8_STRAW|nr:MULTISPECIES: helix-turn-helix transcriptional regulator [Streptomyces]KUN50439.1 XRE family transcriptional regulator [Streptomyces avermitilis]MYT01203.1 helix-turn-helix domain-containing protein [Streptomyces sp. SID5469]OOV30808.1 transcriptional regulator [Streptomyces avermitilis]BAC73338.1 putative DNA-binding protein [Streptomyces avermitilis MA-4680 = NBRC 14893]BBJ53798.1 transcriptional regulator [Streptomyces avermitilis]